MNDCLSSCPLYGFHPQIDPIAPPSAHQALVYFLTERARVLELARCHTEAKIFQDLAASTTQCLERYPRIPSSKPTLTLYRRQFDTWMKNQGYSPKLRASYLSGMSRFRDFTNKPINQWVWEDVRNYLNHMVSTKATASAQANALSVLRSFFREILKREVRS